MNAVEPQEMVRVLLPLLRRFCPAEYGIALGGSYAKGIGDVQSDVDVYLFLERTLPTECRRELVEEVVGPGAEVNSWGQDEPFVEGGTDFWYRGRRVEVWLRHSGRVAETIAACRQGHIRRDWLYWTVMGFFNYVVLGDLHAMRVVEDPYGILAGWQREVAVYPEELRQAILARFAAEARFWPDNLHYRSAVERGDVIYASGIVQLVVYALIQVVFALNRAYFPGEKKLAETLGKLARQPVGFAGRVQALLYPARPPSVEALWAERRELGELVAEVEELVKASA